MPGARGASGAFPYVILDARYEKVRHGGCLVDCAILIALGIDPQGKRTILGVSAALSEAEVHWRTFLQSLQQRGLQGVTYIVSDDHAGLSAARTAVFPAVPWQRCQFHLQQNAQAYVPRLELRAQVAQDIRTVFNAPDRPAAQLRLQQVVARYTTSAPKLATWMEENLPQGFTVFSLPTAHQRQLRTSNALERVNQELKRRTRVAGMFPNEASVLRLVTALLVEISEQWETGKIYLHESANSTLSLALIPSHFTEKNLRGPVAAFPWLTPWANLCRCSAARPTLPRQESGMRPPSGSHRTLRFTFHSGCSHSSAAVNFYSYETHSPTPLRRSRPPL